MTGLPGVGVRIRIRSSGSETGLLGRWVDQCFRLASLFVRKKLKFRCKVLASCRSAFPSCWVQAIIGHPRQEGEEIWLRRLQPPARAIRDYSFI